MPDRPRFWMWFAMFYFCNTQYNIRLFENGVGLSSSCSPPSLSPPPPPPPLSLSLSKQKHRKQQLPLNLNFETTPVEPVSKHRLLRVTLEKQLKWQAHINNICRTVSRSIFLFSKLSQIVNHKGTLDFFFAHIMSHIDCFKCMGWMFVCAHEATVLSPRTCHRILNDKS